MSDDTFDLMIEMVVASMDEVSLKKKFCRSVWINGESLSIGKMNLIWYHPREIYI